MLATGKKIVLVVDDNFINRQIMCKILQDDYFTVQAANGREALNTLYEYGDSISAILLDIFMPIMNGYKFLEIIKEDPVLASVPIIVCTQNETEEIEMQALKMGAVDFLSKPYNPPIIRQRIANMIKLRETSAFINTVERDSLTGMYSKEAFYARAKEFMAKESEKNYDFVAIDLNDFKIVNDMFGEKIGDELLAYWSKIVIDTFGEDNIYGRITGDVFAVCMPRIENYSNEIFTQAVSRLNSFDVQIVLDVSFGIYRVDDDTIPVSLMCDRAILAIKNGRNDRNDRSKVYAFYDEKLKKELWNSQQIISDMREALDKEQFKVYLQAKCDLQSEKIVGAEALIRWIHPEKGFMSPADFVPLFEKNGFITDVDLFVCDKVCALIRSWIDEGIKPIPISVNISRVDIYNPNLKDSIVSFVKKYDIPVKYLHIEITETAYTENAKQLIDTVIALRNEGFHIEMDDFGSGYSSLNMLSEVPVDTLKLDMGFLRHQTEDGHDGNILNFVINLAKWLDLAVIAEGIELKEQLDFLKSLGCSYGQGYYFSKPIPIEEFNELRKSMEEQDYREILALKDYSDIKLSEIWTGSSDFNKIFNEYIGALVVAEFTKKSLSVVRANEVFYNLFDESERDKISVANLYDYMDDENKKKLINAVDWAAENKSTFNITIKWNIKGKPVFMRERGRIISANEERTIVLLDVEDVSENVKLTEEKASFSGILEFAIKNDGILYFSYYPENDIALLDERTAEEFSLPERLENFSQEAVEFMGVDRRSKTDFEEIVEYAKAGKSKSPEIVYFKNKSYKIGVYSIKNEETGMSKSVFILQ